MNILSLFPLIPLVMMLGLWISKNTRQIHAVMVAGSSALLALAIYLVFHYLGLRDAGAEGAMLLTDSVVWYAPLNIHYAVGVDGISVAMLLLSAIIVFTGTFASWQMKSDVKAYFLWFCLLSVGVFGFFITVDLFSMFMFYEVALIPMYLLIGVWGSGRKEAQTDKHAPNHHQGQFAPQRRTYARELVAYGRGYEPAAHHHALVLGRSHLGHQRYTDRRKQQLGKCENQVSGNEQVGGYISHMIGVVGSRKTDRRQGHQQISSTGYKHTQTYLYGSFGFLAFLG